MNNIIGTIEDNSMEVIVEIQGSGPKGDPGEKGEKGDPGEVDYTILDLKADKTYVDSQDALKADKTYVDSKVQTDVPANAKFTDTVYEHPSTHSADIIVDGTTNKVFTAIEKTKLSGIEAGANNYTHPATHSADIIVDGTTNKVFTATEKTKLSNIEENANNYIHPTNHPPNIISQDSNNRFVTDTEKSAWNNKWDFDEETIKQVKVDNAANADTVNGKTVESNVPAGAKFTDTLTTINGKTGAITKADIVALGIPAQDTVYTHPDKHAISEVDGLQTALDGKVNTSQVLTNVPAGAVFTDTVTTINGKTGAISKADIVALGIPSQDTTYSEISTSEIDAGTSSTLRTITGRRLKYLLDKIVALFPTKVSELANDSGFLTSVTKSDVGLSNVDNVKQMPISGGVLENYREKLVTLSGTSTAINLSLGNVFTHTLSGNTTYSITNAVSGQAHSFTLIITQTETARTITFPASVKWQGGEIPDMTTASKTYVLTFMTIDGGTNWLGMFGGEF